MNELHKTWFEADGDNTYALDWPIDSGSHVWEIGGFEGRWAQQMWDKYHCNITIFEPQPWAVERMKKRFDGIYNIDIRPYGLWLDYQNINMGAFETDGASIFSSKEPIRNCEFRYYYPEFILTFDIDLCLMNIEGAEYMLLPEFVNSGVIKKINHFWCQFHPFDEYDHRHEEIFSAIAETHEMIWKFWPTAVAWRRR